MVLSLDEIDGRLLTLVEYERKETTDGAGEWRLEEGGRLGSALITSVGSDRVAELTIEGLTVLYSVCSEGVTSDVSSHVEKAGL